MLLGRRELGQYAWVQASPLTDLAPYHNLLLETPSNLLLHKTLRVASVGLPKEWANCS